MNVDICLPLVSCAPLQVPVEMSSTASSINDASILYSLAVFGLPTIVFFLLAVFHIIRLRGNIMFMGRWVMLQRYPFTFEPDQLANWAMYSFLFMTFFLLLPMVLLICWAVSAFINFPHLYGYIVIFMGMSAYLAVWALVRWYV